MCMALRFLTGRIAQAWITGKLLYFSPCGYLADDGKACFWFSKWLCYTGLLAGCTCHTHPLAMTMEQSQISRTVL